MVSQLMGFAAFISYLRCMMQTIPIITLVKTLSKKAIVLFSYFLDFHRVAKQLQYQGGFWGVIPSHFYQYPFYLNSSQIASKIGNIAY